MLELVDLKAHLESAEVRDLLYALVGWREDEASNRVALARTLAYYRNDKNARLYGVCDGVTLVGLIGLETITPVELELRHLVVHPDYRASGVGRAMIEAAYKRWRPSRLAAETDASAVGFYRRCGFFVWGLGETYPGVERFLCVLGRPEQEGS